MGALTSKTINFGHLIAVCGIILLNLDKLGLSQQHYGMAFIGVSIVTYILRAVTTKPLSDK